MPVRPFPEKTGNPTRDNRARVLNRRIRQTVRARYSFTTPSGWKRKRVLTRVEGGNLARVYAAVMVDIANEQRSSR